MSKKQNRANTARRSSGAWWLVFFVVAAAAAGLWWTSQRPRLPGKNSSPATGAKPAALVADPLAFNTNDTNVSTMEVAQSVMVTHPLDYGDRVPSAAEAILDIQRLSKPDDGTGRTFAILEAVGFTNAEGKLQLSLRISSEEPGLAAVVFKRTGQVLWKARIVPRAGPPPGEKQLTVMLEDDEGKQAVVDGSKNPSHILNAAIHQSPLTMREHWPNGTERNFKFIYSACGCPVMVKVRRLGEQTMRTSTNPVLFPDDPDVMRVINSLMGWPDDGIPRG